ncbi:hypothetical protein Ddye_021466 [Dipteronia dyeriana]|uniref:Uncharacterized protein n=1 Tax=Dipteronia dyeriana TaxID=168575 RepID=A0AAD9U1P3_9ROSI|nr:hypothetical protein Ddye_021466 [Dipteronia dyeriana]
MQNQLQKLVMSLSFKLSQSLSLRVSAAEKKILEKIQLKQLLANAGWMAKAYASSSVQAAAVTALSIHVPQNQGHSCVLKAADFDMSVQTLAGFNSSQTSW